MNEMYKQEYELYIASLSIDIIYDYFSIPILGYQ